MFLLLLSLQTKTSIPLLLKLHKAFNMKGIDILYNVDYSIFYMKEYKVKVETRKQFKTLIDADSPQEAQELLLQKILKGEAKMEDDGLITFLEVKEIKE